MRRKGEQKTNFEDNQRIVERKQTKKSEREKKKKKIGKEKDEIYLGSLKKKEGRTKKRTSRAELQILSCPNRAKYILFFFMLACMHVEISD
jgi:hypothetical protein